jgi:hypothetical protein
VTNLAGRAGKVRDAALAIVQTPDGGVRVEDYLTVLAAAVGEAALVRPAAMSSTPRSCPDLRCSSTR